jgi:hypothetical protein
VRQAYVHRLVLRPDVGFDDRAPGGAVTRELCGSWDHVGDCLVPHHNAARADEDGLELRVVFVAGADVEPLVRRRIWGAVGAGMLVGPDSRTSHWELLEHGPDELTAAERTLAAQWLAS